MGLAEKRAVQTYQNGRFVEIKAKIKEAAGFEFPVNVDWDSLAIEEQSHLYEDGFQKVYFTPLLEALQSICKDQMGRDALKASLKEVRILNKSGNYSPTKAIVYEAGVLTINHEPTSNMGDVTDRTNRIISLIENAL